MYTEGYPLRRLNLTILDTKIIPNVYYKIYKPERALGLGIDGKKRTGDLIFLQSTTGEGGLWEFIPLAGGYFAIKNKMSGKFLVKLSEHC